MSEEAPNRKGRRASDRVADAQDSHTAAPSPAAPPADPAFAAQLITQGTVKRGLRGGKEVLDAARTSYLKTEWSGPADRRPAQGILTRTKV
jgi:hypothetical protein